MRDLVTDALQDKLTVSPTLVYGDPPVARVDRGRLVLLGGALPLRDEGVESHLTARLARPLGLEPGRVPKACIDTCKTASYGS